MTNKEAIDWIKSLITEMKKDTTGPLHDPEYKNEVYEALNKGIEALKYMDQKQKEEQDARIFAALASGKEYWRQ